MNKQRKKIAILITVAGGGHLSVAKSLQQMLSSDFNVVIINFYSEVIKSKDENIYNRILKYNLSFLYWPLFIKLLRIKLFFLEKYYIKISHKYFKQNHFDLVISVIPFFNGIISESLNTKFAIIPTDLANPYPSYWYAKSDLIITCTNKLFEQAKILGYNNLKKISSLPLRQEFYLSKKIKTQTNNMLNVLIMYGKNPPNRLIDIIHKLYNISGIKITIICGENNLLFNELNKLENILVYELINNIHEIIDNNDVVITKPGPTTIVEVISRGKYLFVENGFNVMRHERYNLDFVVNNSYGEQFHTTDELIKKLLAFDPRNFLPKQILKAPNKELVQIINSLIKDPSKFNS